MIKVLHILSADLLGGAEVMVITLLKALQKQDRLHLKVVLLNAGTVADRLMALGLDVTIIDERKNGLFRLVFSLRRMVKTFKPAVIHSHGYKENILSFLASAGPYRTCLMSTLHGLPEIHNATTTFIHRLALMVNFLILRKQFSLLVAVSNELRGKLIQVFKINSKNIAVVHNGIELFRRPETEKKSRFVIGSGGRLFPVKNFSLFVEMAAIVMRRNRNILFELAGDGPEMDKLRMLCVQNGLENHFFFKGHVRDMKAFYRGLDLYVNTSIHEGIPLGVLEAMAHGLPIVAPDVGGLSEIVDNGRQGFLIPRHDPALFAQKCLEVLGDCKKRERLSKAAVEKIKKRFSADQMGWGYFGLYNRLQANSEKEGRKSCMDILFSREK